MRPRAAILCWLWLGLSTAAQAHKSSDAYLSWHIDGAKIEQRIDIALRDLDRELELDADDDGQLRWGEVRRRWTEIAGQAAAGVRVTADGRTCETVGTAAPQLDEHTDGRYAVVQQTLRCAGPVGVLDVDYALFASSDATHRGMARFGEHSAVLVPGAGLQHFVVDPGQGAAGRMSRFLGFVAEGVHHIAVGLDHILFLVTLLMVAVWRRDGTGWVPRTSAASAWRETLRLVTAFTVAHSLTLGLAAAGVLAPPARWVESLIAASVVVAALDNLWLFIPLPRWTMASLFGLVHGFGFAGPLQALGLQRGALAVPLLGFNLGVEIGQLALVAVLLPLACLLRHARGYRVGVVRGGSAAIASVAMVWMLERSFEFSLLP